MHVDEVQIDGGGTEAVITGNMENLGKRLIVLEGDEVEALARFWKELLKRRRKPETMRRPSDSRR